MMLLLSLVTQTGRMQQKQKKGFNQHEKSGVHRSVVNRFVDVPSSTDDIFGTVTKDLLQIQKKKFSALMKILSTLRVKDCLYAAIVILYQIFVNYFYCGKKTILTFRNDFTKKQTDLFHQSLKMKF